MYVAIPCVQVTGANGLETPTQVITMEQGETSTLALSLTDELGEAVDLTDGALIWTLKQDLTSATAVVSREAIVVSAVGGTANVELVIDDTKAVTPGLYYHEVIFIDAGGNPFHVVNASAFNLKYSVYVDDQPVTVPTSQAPLAQGPAGTNGTTLPSQSTHSGQFLTTDGGSTLSWATAGTTLPSQTGNAGKFLTTDGASLSWDEAEAFKVFWSEAELAKIAQPLGAITFQGNYTGGHCFYPTHGGYAISAVRFFWTGGAKTIKCSLWNSAGTQVATVNKAVTTADIYTATFAAPVAVSAFALHYVSIWPNDGSGRYTITRGNYNTTIGVAAPNGPIPETTNLAAGFVAGEAYVRVAGSYGTGDTFPTNLDLTQIYMLDPIFSSV